MIDNKEEIYVFYHIAVMGDDWERIIKEQVQTLYDSGLMEIATGVYACILGDYEKLFTLNILRDIQILEKNHDLLYTEQFTIKYLKECCELHPNAKVLYFHTKGVSKNKNHYQSANVNNWRKYMEYFNIEKWQDCVKTLDKYDACGVLWSYQNNSPRQFMNVWNIPITEAHRHFSGNFWWITAKLMNRITNLSFWYIYLNENTVDMRYSAEFFLHHNWQQLCKISKPKIKCIDYAPYDLYNYSYPRINYATDDKTQQLKEDLKRKKGLLIGCNNVRLQILCKYTQLTYLYQCDKYNHPNTKTITDLQDISNDLDWIYIAKDYPINIYEMIVSLYDNLKYGGTISSNYQLSPAFLKKLDIAMHIEYTYHNHWTIFKNNENSPIGV